MGTGNPFGPKYVPYTYMDPLGPRTPWVEGNDTLVVRVLSWNAAISSCDHGVGAAGHIYHIYMYILI